MGTLDVGHGAERLREFREKVMALDFDQDIAQYLKVLEEYQSIEQPEKPTAVEEKSVEVPAEGVYQTPEQLVARFAEIYSQTETCYQFAYWESALKSVKENSTVEGIMFCKPIYDFLFDHSLIKTEVFRLISQSFPFNDFHRTDLWKEMIAHSENYVYIENLLARGNFGLDLISDAMPIEQYDRAQLDEILPNLLYSSRLVRNEDYINAFKVLSRINKDIMPVVGWQRMLNILYKASVKQGQTDPRDIFLSVMDDALIRYPRDEHLLYLRGAFLMAFHPVEETKAFLIQNLKHNPLHFKSLYLLGKCYLELKEFAVAHTIFGKLNSVNPQNLTYSAYQAVALHGMVNQPVQADTKEEELAGYKVRMMQLLDLKVYDMPEFPAEFAGDVDIKALGVYAYSASRQFYQGGLEPTYLPRDLKMALQLAKDPEVRLFIIKGLLACYPNFDDLVNNKETVLQFVEEFPDADSTNFALAGLLYAEEKFEQALTYYERVRDLNPAHTFSYLGIARCAEKLEDYPKAIEASGVFQHARKYDGRGFDIMGTCYYNMGNYRKAYENFQWMVQLRKPSGRDQFILLASLGNLVDELDGKDFQSGWLMEHVEEGLDLFDSFERTAEFQEYVNAPWVFLRGAKLCEFLGRHEQGLEYINQAFELLYAKGMNNLLEVALVRGRLMNALGHYGHAKEFLSNYISFLEREDTDEQELESFRTLLVEVEKGLADADNEYLQDLSVLVERATEEPETWQPVFVQLMRKAMMGQANTEMVAIGGRYFEFYPTPVPDHVFMGFWTGKAHFQLEEVEKSMGYFQKCLEWGESFPQPYYNLLTMAGNYIRNNQS